MSVILRVVRLVMNLVVISLIARYLGKEGFGYLTVAMSIVLVLACFTELGMQTIVTRDLVTDSPEQWVTLGSAFYARILAGLAAYAGLGVYVWLVKPEHAELLLIYGSILIFSAGSVLTVWLSAKNKAEAVSWAQIAGFLGGACVMLLGIVFKAPVWVFAFSFVAECLVTLLVSLLIFRSRGGRIRLWKWSSLRTRILLKESWYELATQVALLLLLRVDTIMLEAMRGTAEAGVYGAAVRIAEAVYFIPALLASFCFPPLVALRGRDMGRYQKRFREYFSLTFLIAIPGAVFLAFVAPYLISVVFGKDFSASAPILGVHAWALIPYAIGITRNSYLTAESRLWLNFPCVICALALNILLNYFWIPASGGIGAAWATLTAYSVGWVLSAFLLPQTRDLASLMLGGLREIPSFLSQWRHLRPSRELD